MDDNSCLLDNHKPPIGICGRGVLGAQSHRRNSRNGHVCAPQARALPRAALILAGSISGAGLALAVAGDDAPDNQYPAPHQYFDAGDRDGGVNYRHMSLYTLKQLRLNRGGGFSSGEKPQLPSAHHTHHHEHWGSGLSHGSWGRARMFGASESFQERVIRGLSEAASAATVLAILATVSYSIAQTLFTLFPYDGAASLTAIELPKDSPWKITGYRMANGLAIRDSHFHGNKDAQAVTRENQMFDREINPQGRFLLLDQENWWGLADYPLNADVEFTRYDENGMATARAMIRFQRSVTNGIKPGLIKARLITSQPGDSRDNIRGFKLHCAYPYWTEFSRWYHEPTIATVMFTTQ